MSRGLSAVVGEPHRLSESVAPQAQQPLGDPHVTHQPRQIGYWPVDRPFPVLLTPGELMLVFGVKRSQFYKLQKLGRFRFLETHPHVTAAIYSGAKVAAYCEGQSEFSLGRKRAR